MAMTDEQLRARVRELIASGNLPSEPTWTRLPAS